MDFGIDELTPNPCYNIVIMTEKKKAPAGSSFWQIIFPTLIGTSLLMLAGIWVVLYTSPGNISRFAELSTVLLVIPVLFGSVLVMLLLGALIALVLKIIQVLPSITGKILEVLQQVQDVVEGLSKNSVKPIVRPAALMAGIRRLFSKDDSRVQID